jgi:hypothetical protein
VGSNPTQGMDVWCVCVCVCVSVVLPCDELITHPRSPTVFKMIIKLTVGTQREETETPIIQRYTRTVWVADKVIRQATKESLKKANRKTYCGIAKPLSLYGNTSSVMYIFLQN